MPSGLDLLEDVGKTNLAPKSNLPPFDIALQPGADPEEEAMKLASSKSGLDLLALEEKKVVEPTKIVPEDNAGILSTIANFFKSEPTYTPAPKGTKPASPTTMYNEYGTPTEYAGAGPIMVASRPESLPTEPPKLEAPKTELQTAQGAGKLAKDVLANKYPSAKNSYLLQTARMFDLPEKLPPDLGKVITSGYARSVGGTRARARGGNFPTLTPEEYGKLGAFGQFAHSLITFGFDLPVYMVGGMIGSAAGPPGVVGGAFGFAEGLRSYYDQQLEKGEVTGPRDFLDRALKTGLETLKGVATGKTMEAAGALGKATGVPLAKTISEAGALATVPAALEARFPTKEEYYDAASFLLGLNVITRGPRAIGKMREIFRKTGRLPSELKKDVETDPKLADVLTNEEDKVPEDVIQRAKEKVAETAKVQADLEAAKELAKKRPTAEELVTEELKEKGKKVRKAKGKKVEEEVVEEPIKEEAGEELLDERDVYLELRTLGYSDKDIKGMAKEQKELIVDQGTKKGWKSEEELAKEEKEGKVKKRRGKKAAEIVKVEEPKVEEPTTKVKKPRKRIKPDPITPIDEDLGESPAELKGADHPFRDKDPEHTKVMSNLYRDKVKNASATPELYVRYLINGVNRYLNGEEVPIEKIRDGLSELATRSEELRGKFARTVDFENFREMAEEAAKWARTTDRLNVKRTRGPSEVQLNMMIPVDQLPEMVKDVMKGIKAGTARFGNLYRNREVWEKTGFWLGKDGKWRYEIGADEVKYNPSGFGWSMDPRLAESNTEYLSAVADVKTLSEKVPGIENIKVRIDPDLKRKEGKYNPTSKTITLKSMHNEDVFHHELQHAVNDIVKSRFRGSNVEAEEVKLTMDFLSKLVTRVTDEGTRNQIAAIMADRDVRIGDRVKAHNRIEMIKRDANSIDRRKIDETISEFINKDARENYMKDPGEMEARLASIRMEMTPEQRKAEPPWETLDNMLIDEAVNSNVEFSDAAADKLMKTSSTLYTGIDPTQIKETARIVKETWKELRDKDSEFFDKVKSWLKGTSDTKPNPSNIYRGVPKGEDVARKGTDYTHGTPWGYTAARGGKGAFGSPESYDVYELPATKDTVYYRGGSLAGDPLESTRIKNVGGMSFDQILDEAKKLYKADLEKEIADNKRRRLESDGYEEERVAQRVANDIRIAAFETDLQNNPGIWRGKDLTKSIDREMPRLRNYAELGRVIAYKRGRGIPDDKIAELQIIKNAPAGVKLYSGIDPTEATRQIIKGAKDFMAYTAEARGMKAFKPRAAADTAMRELIRSGVDRSGNIRRDLLDQLGDEGYRIIQSMYLSKGASSLAVQQLKQMRKEVYGGLDKNNRRILDNLILADRMLDIGKYKTAKEFKFPEGLTPTEAAAYNELFQFTEKITPEKAAELQQRAKSYFEWMKKPLKDMLEAELITQEEYDALASHNYRRLKLVDIFDRRYQAKIGKKSRTVYDSGVEALARGRETDIFEPSSEIMALEVFNRAYGRILNNAANRTLLDLARNNKENPFVRLKDEKGEKIPTGWNRIYVYEKGERQALYLSPEMSKEWITNNPEMSYKMSQIIRYASGSPVLRTFATGIDWGFALANLPRDVMHAWFAARVFNGKKWESAYSPHLPVFVLQMLHDQLSVFTDVLLRRGVYEDYIKEGGGMEFLVHQGRLLQRGRHIEGRLDKLQDFLGYLGETTELMTRLSIRNRVIRKRANELGISFDEAYKNEKIRTEATFAARDYMDFGQGGGVGKALDNGIPYLNASIQGTRGLFRSARDNPMEFTYKLAQFATVVSGLYIANQAINPDTMKDLKGSIDMQNNLCIPLGDKLGFVDEKGQMRYIYFKIPIDPGQKFFKSLFEAGTDKWLGNEVDTEAIANTFTQISPVGISSLPPTMSGTLGYMVNKDFWKGEDIWKKTEQPSSWQLPKMLTGEQIGGSEEEFIPGRTPQAYIDLGKVTGLSPERAKYAIEQLITSGSMWGWMVGQGYEKVLGELPQDKREMHIAEALTKIPVIRRFIGITDPYAKFAQPIKETKEEGMFERWAQNRGLDAKVEGYLYQGNVERSEITDYIKSFKDKDTQDRLKDRFEFSVNIKELPNRSFWLSLKGVQDVDARAKLLNDRMRGSNDEQRAQLYREIATVEKAGGIISEDFKKAFMKYRSESVQ